MTTNVLKTCEINGKERTQDVLIDTNINFESLLLSANTLEGLKKCTFQKPSPIQLKAIPLGRCGFDLIVKSKSGTGKTAVFAVIGLEMVNVKKQQLQILVVAPTREIALQGCEVINSIGSEFKGLKASCFIGGMPIEEDIQKMQGCQIAVGTPGRLKHLILSSHLKTDHLKLFILDEADKLMESSYQSDINEIYHSLPLRKQMLALSATYPDELDKFLSKYMHTPTHVTAEMETPVLLGLKQIVCVVKSNFNVMQQMTIKIDKIVDVLSKVSFTQCLIFSNFQTRAESISNTLNRKGWKSNFIAGSQSQEERIEAIKDLKESKCKILLSTDLTARGIDASNVDLVINFDVPHDASTYLHRMGRAGRYGSRGICITIASKGNEIKQFEGILGMIGGNSMKIARMPEEIPEKIWEVNLNSFEQIVGQIPEGDYTEESMRIKNIKSSILELKSGKDVKSEVGNSKNTETVKNEVSTTRANLIFDSAAANEEIIKNKKIDVNTTEDILKLLSQGKRPSSGTISKAIGKGKQSCEEKIVKKNIDESTDANVKASCSEATKSKIEDESTAINTIDILKMLSGNQINESSASTAVKSIETERSNSLEKNLKTVDVLNLLSGADTVDKYAHDINTHQTRNLDTMNVLKMVSENQTSEDKNKSQTVNLGSNSTEKILNTEDEGLKKNLNTEDVLKILSGDATEETLGEKDVNLKEGSLDTINVLKMLSGDESKASETSSHETKNLTEDSSSKRKREDKNHTQQDTKRSLICEKNISLLNITKLLLNEDFCEEKDVTENISSYLEKIRKENNPSPESECMETEHENETAQANKIISEDIIKLNKENIFLHAYESAVDPSKPHWSTLVNFSGEAEEVEEEGDKAVDLLNCSDGYEEEDSEEVTSYRKNKSRNRKKSWTKRKISRIDEHSYINNGLSNEFHNTLFNNELANNEDLDNTEVTFPAGLYSYHEYGNSRTFDSMFENCSKDLDEKINEIEDVDSYDEWFVQWQQQVQSVRDYVQQNVYLQEMNRYQYYRTN